MLAVSTGSPADSTRVKAAMCAPWRSCFSLRSETSCVHTHATYLKPFLIQGVATSTDEQIGLHRGEVSGSADRLIPLPVSARISRFSAGSRVRSRQTWLPV